MTLNGVPLYVMLIALFVFGAVIGSFLNVCIYRIPRHERFFAQLKGLTSPPSSCPGCGNRIPGIDNLPIIGWLKLGGRCRFCRMRISPRYPLIELLNGLLFVLVYWYEIPGEWTATISDSPFFGTSGLDAQDFTRESARALLHWRYLYHMVLIEALLVATFIDFDLKIIPDGCTLPAMAVGLLGAALSGKLFLVPLWSQDPSLMQRLRIFFPEEWHSLFPLTQTPAWIADWPHWHGLLVSLAGFVVGGGVVWTVRLIGKSVLREEAMGFGDVILMAMIGSFLGWQPTLIVFFIAPVCALGVVIFSWLFRRQREIPYGPYLSLAALIVLLGWKRVWSASEQIFDLGPLLPVFAIFSAAMLALALLLVQFLKYLFGVPLYREQWIEEWTSADQLMQFAGDKIDEQMHNPQSKQVTQWPGTAAGRGTLHAHRWRGGRSD